MPCPNPCGQVSVIVKAFDYKKLLKIFKQSPTRESVKSKFTNILFLNSMTLGSTLMLFCKLDKFCGPFGAVPYIGCPTFVKFGFMANHENASLICLESAF